MPAGEVKRQWREGLGPIIWPLTCSKLGADSQARPWDFDSALLLPVVSVPSPLFQLEASLSIWAVTYPVWATSGTSVSPGI